MKISGWRPREGEDPSLAARRPAPRRRESNCPKPPSCLCNLKVNGQVVFELESLECGNQKKNKENVS